MAVRHRRNRQQIDDLLDLFAKSNLTVKDFCQEHSISRANFHRWRSRYRSHEGSKKKTSGLPAGQAGFATIDIAGSSLGLQGLFAEVKGIRFYQPVTASFLKELLA